MMSKEMLDNQKEQDRIAQERYDRSLMNLGRSRKKPRSPQSHLTPKKKKRK